MLQRYLDQRCSLHREGIYPIRIGRRDRTTVGHTWVLHEELLVLGLWNVRGQGYRWMGKDRREDRISTESSKGGNEQRV